MHPFVYRSIFFLALTAVCLYAGDGSYTYVTGHPGKASIIIETSNTARFALKPAEASAFHANLGRLRDLLTAQPVFHPLRGVEINGYIRGDHGGQALKTAPARGRGIIIYYPYVIGSKTKQPFRVDASPWELDIFCNSPGEGLSVADIRDPSGKMKLFYEPKPAGEIQGFPVYRGSASNEFIVLSSTGKPAWIPVTREEYIQHCIRFIEKELADESREISKSRAQISQAELALLSPKDRTEIEKVLADDTALEIHKQRLKSHQEALARMSPQERAAQAQYGDPGNGDYLGPQLAPIGREGIGPAFVKANPDWFDPSRPRSDLQLIVVRFNYLSDLLPDRPTELEDSSIADRRLWETLHTSDWKAISGALAR